MEKRSRRVFFSFPSLSVRPVGSFEAHLFILDWLLCCILCSNDNWIMSNLRWPLHRVYQLCKYVTQSPTCYLWIILRDNLRNIAHFESVSECMTTSSKLTDLSHFSTTWEFRDTFFLVSLRWWFWNMNGMSFECSLTEVWEKNGSEVLEICPQFFERINFCDSTTSELMPAGFMLDLNLFLYFWEIDPISNKKKMKIANDLVETCELIPRTRFVGFHTLDIGSRCW